MIEFTDEALKYIVLGTFRGMVLMPEYPVRVRAIEDVTDENGEIQYFVIVTQSGLRFSVHVEYEPDEPVPKTQEEKIAFRKEWDARVDEGKQT